MASTKNGIHVGNYGTGTSLSLARNTASVKSGTRILNCTNTTLTMKTKNMENINNGYLMDAFNIIYITTTAMLLNGVTNVVGLPMRQTPVYGSN